MNKIGTIFAFVVAIALAHAQFGLDEEHSSTAPITKLAPSEASAKPLTDKSSGPSKATEGTIPTTIEKSTAAPTTTEKSTAAPTHITTEKSTPGISTHATNPSAHTSEVPVTRTSQSSSTTAFTTAAAMTTAEAQTTVAPPSTGVYNNSCVRMEMHVSFNVSYNNNSKIEYIQFDLPTTGQGLSVSGNCGNSTDTLSVVFNPAGFDNAAVTFSFTTSGDNHMLSSILLGYQVSGHNATTVSKSGLSLFKGEQAYICKVEQKVIFDNSDDSSVTFKDATVEAFMKDSSQFGQAVECSEDNKTDNIVPIAVGAALAALVVIVLIAYLISRQRNKRGYESV